MKVIISLIFLILSTGFVVTLLMGIMKLLSQDFKNADSLGSRILKIFRTPLIILIVFTIFLLFILPRLEEMAI